MNDWQKEILQRLEERRNELAFEMQEIEVAIKCLKDVFDGAKPARTMDELEEM